MNLLNSIMETEFEDRRKGFYTALMGEDELGLVIRAHIHVEHELIEFINRKLMEPAMLGNSYVSYAARVSLALALGLPKCLKDPLNALNRLRNDFAHALGTSLTEDKVQKFYGTFNETMKQAVQVSYDSMRTNTPSPAQPSQIKTLIPRDRFVLYVINLWAVVVAEVQSIDLSEPSPDRT